MGRNYLVGMSGKLTLDAMPYRASVQVETVSEQGQPLYVADSANTATSLATGGITQIGRIATDIEDNDLTTIAERALDSGFRVGLVTTSSLTDATPASFLAHVSARSCEGPEEVLGPITAYRSLPALMTPATTAAPAPLSNSWSTVALRCCWAGAPNFWSKPPSMVRP